MSGINSPKTFGKSNGSAVKQFENSAPYIIGSESFLLLPLPKDFNNYEWKGVSENINGKAILLGEVDKILTEYSNRRLKIVFTLEFIEFVDSQFLMFSLNKEKDKISFAVNLFFTISGYFPLIYGTEVRRVLAFYLSFLPDGNNSISGMYSIFGDLKNLNNIFRAELSLNLLEQTYLDKLKQTIINRPGKPPIKFQITEDWSQELIKAVNDDMEADVDVYFINAKAQAAQIPPDDIKNDARYLASMHDASWNEYDETIKKEVAFYNQKFAGVANFVPLDWQYVKAMIWTEVMAGPKGNAEQWTKFPLQIGRFTQDAGYDVVSGKAKNPADIEKMQIVSPQLTPDVQNKGNVVRHLNVRAGIAYLYIRAIDNVEDKPDKILYDEILTDKILPNEGLAAFAKRNGTTVANILLKQEVDSANLQPGQAIKFQKAQAVRGIRNWKDWRTTIRGYNGDAEWVTNPKTKKQEIKGSGDPNYLQKLDIAYQIIKFRQ